MVNTAQVMQLPGYVVAGVEVLEITNARISKADITLTLIDLEKGFTKGVDGTSMRDNNHCFILVLAEQPGQKLGDAFPVRLYLAVDTLL